MSYLESGKTPRTMFSDMPPKTHDVDTSKSEVLAYICQQMGCDVAKAVRLFNSMRHPKCRVLVFDKVERQWKGCAYRPGDAETSELSMLREHRSLERQVAAVRSELRRLAREVESLKKSSFSRRKRKGQNQEEPKPEVSSTESPEKSDGDEPSLADEFAELLKSIK
jgi:hypothetical protein